MLNRRDRRRRIVGALILGSALVQLIAGLTVLKSFLRDHAGWFLIFWAICWLLAMISLVFAFIDARAVHQHSRDEHAKLLKSAFEDLSPPKPPSKNHRRNGKPGTFFPS